MVMLLWSFAPVFHVQKEYCTFLKLPDKNQVNLDQFVFLNRKLNTSKMQRFKSYMHFVILCVNWMHSMLRQNIKRRLTVGETLNIILNIIIFAVVQYSHQSLSITWECIRVLFSSRLTLCVKFLPRCFAGSEPAHQSQCPACTLQHSSYDHCPDNDAGHQRSCFRHVSIRQEDSCSCNS